MIRRDREPCRLRCQSSREARKLGRRGCPLYAHRREPSRPAGMATTSARSALPPGRAATASSAPVRTGAARTARQPRRASPRARRDRDLSAPARSIRFDALYFIDTMETLIQQPPARAGHVRPRRIAVAPLTAVGYRRLTRWAAGAAMASQICVSRTLHTLPEMASVLPSARATLNH